MNLLFSLVEDMLVDVNMLSYEIILLEFNSEYRIRILVFIVVDGLKSDLKLVYMDNKVFLCKCFWIYIVG